MKWKKRSTEQLTLVMTVVAFLGVILPSLSVLARADTINAGVYSTIEKPYGLSYGDWTANFWKWVYSIPKDISPASDQTGKSCAQSQNGPVWFLLGTISGSAERTCTIPAGKAILFPILNSECSYAETPTAKTGSELQTCAVTSDKGVTNLQATVDGKNLQQLDKYRVTSSLFNFTFANPNISGAPIGPTQGVSDGWWVFLKPLTPGKHEIHFTGVIVNPTVTSTSSRYVTDVIYHLTVQ